MEVLDKILAWIKNIVIDWRIGTVGFVGFTTGLIVTKDTNYNHRNSYCCFYDYS